jgi:hypothetical protein
MPGASKGKGNAVFYLNSVAVVDLGVITRIVDSIKRPLLEQCIMDLSGRGERGFTCYRGKVRLHSNVRNKCCNIVQNH